MEESGVKCVIEVGGVVGRRRVCGDIVIYISYTWGRSPCAIYMRGIYKWVIYSTVRHVTFVSGSSFIGCRSRALRFCRAL